MTAAACQAAVAYRLEAAGSALPKTNLLTNTTRFSFFDEN